MMNVEQCFRLLAVSLMCAPSVLAQDTRQWDSAQAIPASQTRIEIRDKLEISVDVPGTLVEVARVGDIISKGDIVVRLNDAVVKAQYEEAKAKAESDVLIEFARVKRDVAAVELEEKLEANKNAVASSFSRKSVYTETEIRRAELEVKQGDAEIAKAEHDKQLAELGAKTKAVELQQYQVTSEIDGVVTDVVHPAGEAVRQGDPILTIINIDTVKAVLEVDESYKRQFKVGDTVLVRIRRDAPGSRSPSSRRSPIFSSDESTSVSPAESAGPAAAVTDDETQDRIFEGSVVLISPKLASNERRLEVTAHIQNPTDPEGRHLLRDGQIVEAVILGQ